MVASKFTSDLLYSNARYAMVGGLSLLELNRLELEFLFTIQFELDVKVEELQGVGNSLLRFKHREVESFMSQSIQQQQPASEYGYGYGYDQEEQETQEQQDQQQAAGVVVSTNHHHHNSVMETTKGTNITTNGQSGQPNTGRYSIPSPTSPRGLLVRDGAAVAVTDLMHSSSSSARASPASVTTAATVASSTSAASTSGMTVVVVSESCSQRPQLLSPPEEKEGWEETDVQMIEELEEQTDRIRAEDDVCPTVPQSNSR
ncbi:hypothetical protein BGX31_007390 [Mortierella sp. GBA43]|nr:hypothetical protein BGX31_007390 [Mortierella sp. GBA43]